MISTKETSNSIRDPTVALSLLHHLSSFLFTFRFQWNCKGVREAGLFGRSRRRRFWQGDRHTRRTIVRILKENERVTTRQEEIS